MSKDDQNERASTERPAGFRWKVTLRAEDVDFMQRDDDFIACTDCVNCSMASPLPNPPRKPKHRRATNT